MRVKFCIVIHMIWCRGDVTRWWWSHKRKSQWGFTTWSPDINLHQITNDASENEEIWTVDGVGMNCRQQTTWLYGSRDGNESKKSFWLMGRRGNLGMRVLNRCQSSRRSVCQSHYLSWRQDVCRYCLILFSIQMLPELVQWQRRQRTQIIRSRVMWGCKIFDVAFK